MVRLPERYRKYADWRVLAHFLLNPGTQFHIKQLSRQLEMSPSSVSSAVKMFSEGLGYLVMEEKGLAHLFSLNLENPTVAFLKRAFGVELVTSAQPQKRLLKADPAAISITLIGSFADGSFDQRSDVDILVITQGAKEALVPAARLLEAELGRAVSLSVFRLSEWRALAKKGDAFYKRVIENHILLFGSGLR